MIKTYERHSPSSLNMFAAEPAMFVLERLLGIKQPVGVPAHRGTAVEAGVTHGLLADATLEECVDVAYLKYDTLSVLSGDPRMERYRDTIPDMVARSLECLRKYGRPTTTQGFVQWKPDGLKLPIVGYYDFAWDEHGILADLKTTEKMPGEIKISHARQVALYAASDNMRAHLIYVTPKKIEPYLLENVMEHRNALHNIALHCERFLALSADPSFYVSITMPNLESFYWTNPMARQLAYDYWRI